MTGNQIAEHLTPMTLADREAAVCAEIFRGNVPLSARALVPVTVTATIGRRTRTAVYHVAPEYLMLGSDEDSFLMPMTPTLAQRVANRLGCVLPTRKMVNAIWAAAPVKLAPSPIPPSPQMTTIPVFWDHNLTVRGQRAALLPAHPLGALAGGYKKDVVMTPQLASRPGKVAIYGWHRLDGSPIQQLYLGHGDTYADYSHGIRLVANAMTVDGEPAAVSAVLANAALSALLSDEGPIENPRYPTPAEPPVGGDAVGLK